MKYLYLLILSCCFASCLGGQPLVKDVNPEKIYTTIGNGDLEFIAPASFELIETKIHSETSARTFIESKDYAAHMTIMLEILPKEVTMSYNTTAARAPDGVVRSVPFKTLFGESFLHYSKVEFKPGSTSHEFNVAINTPGAMLMVLCYTHSGGKAKIDKLEAALIEAFESLRLVE